MTVKVVVADEREALLYDAADVNLPLALAAQLENPARQLNDRDLESDKPGRAVNSATGQSSALDGERSSRRTSAQSFARRIAGELERGRNAHGFDRVVLIAAPRMLGLLRDALSEPASELTVAEVAKDLVHADEQTIRAYVPDEVFDRPPPQV
jgi:protein required for attachment to host cells